MRKQHPERQFQNRILEIAAEHGWYRYCHPDSRKSAAISTPGYPDIILLKPRNHVVVMECKMPGRTPTIRQIIWLTLFHMLLADNPHATVGLFYPDQMDEIKQLLTRR